MAEANHEIVLTWLNDAYNVENALVHVLEQHAKEAKEFPDMEAKLEEHLAQTRRHAELVAGRIEALGSAPSTHKDRWAGVLAPLESLFTSSADEESLLKNSFTDYASENFEIATYRAIIMAAQDTGDTDTVHVCQQILGDEQAMAHFLDERMPALVDRIVRQASSASS